MTHSRYLPMTGVARENGDSPVRLAHRRLERCTVPPALVLALFATVLILPPVLYLMVVQSAAAVKS